MWFDVLIVAIIAFTTLRGAIKGVMWQLAAIAALVLCFVFAQSGSLAIAPSIPLKPPANRWVAMFLIYVVFSFISFGVARMLREGLERAKFTEFDRHLGAAFGLVKGVVFALVVVFFSVTMSDGLRETVMKSHSGHYAAIIMDRLHPVMPDELHDVLEPYIHRLDKPGMDLKYGDHDHGHDHDGTHNHDDDPFGPSFDDPFASRNSSGPGGSRPADGSRAVPPPLDPFDDPQMSRREPLPAGREPRFDDDPFSSTRREPSPFDPVPASPRPLDPRPADPRPTPVRPKSEDDVLADLAKRLTGAVSEDVKNQVLDAVRKSDPAERDELILKLTRALPGVLRTMGADPFDDRTPRREPPAPTRDDPFSRPAPRAPRSDDPFDLPIDRSSQLNDRTADRDDDRAEIEVLLHEISETYAVGADDYQAALAEFEESLAGVPESVALSVLRDWRSDLYELDHALDPDPKTDLNTSLDVRIVRQLSAARVPMSDLSESLQRRLRSVERR